MFIIYGFFWGGGEIIRGGGQKTFGVCFLGEGGHQSLRSNEGGIMKVLVVAMF